MPAPITLGFVSMVALSVQILILPYLLTDSGARRKARSPSNRMPINTVQGIFSGGSAPDHDLSWQGGLR